MLERALNRAAMSVSFGMEAADHYGEPYPVIQEIQDWLKGFCEALFRSR
ncbi:hypothetical protein ECL_B003 (plasmid) [Enterobacter cloacae subsp. cloacae ATCC 13047]|uniref:Uncharacterized protein n=2 Tax=Enterobacter cloacae TaxID=550 RepID=A0A2S1LYU0_ENTCL|nr:hypothetical protein ECL_B003 [Enterobacter cloacae subsp. cloacae ATCC 13047]AWG43751.1 hypothetical protein BFJ73_21020 [Enterobacter cloacae]OOC92387.1 hypothetical protein BWP06_04135 [Enterobacter cloacae]